MTAAEMITHFRERYNLSSNIGDHKDENQIYLLLNQAVDRFISTKFTGNNVRQKDFEGDPKRFDDIRSLITNSGNLSAGTANTGYANGQPFVLPSGYRFMVKTFAEISANRYPCERIPHDQADVFIQTGRNVPNLRNNPKVLMMGGSEIMILHDINDTVTNASMMYITDPAIISGVQDCDLPLHTHYEIVEQAVGIAIEGLENPTRAQTHNNQLQQSE